MSTPKEQYDNMLDELSAEDKLRMIDHVPFARILQEVDPIAYRCGLTDTEAVCDDCGDTFWPDDHDAPALCSSCQEADEDSEEA